MKVRVIVYADYDLVFKSPMIACYIMNHDDAAERRVLGEQCRNAFEAGQCVVTYPIKGN